MTVFNNEILTKEISEEFSIEQIAERLVSSTQVPSQYFEYGSLFLLNVSFSEESLQEYAVYKKDDETGSYYKFESLTVSWFKADVLAATLKEYDETPIEEMNSGFPVQSLREYRGICAHIFSFKNLEIFKKAFTDFKEKY